MLNFLRLLFLSFTNRGSINVCLSMQLKMNTKSLIIFLCMVTHAINALHTEELLDSAKNPRKTDFDSIEDILTEAFEEEIKSELLNKESTDKSDKERKSKSDTEPSESRVESSWLDIDGESSNLFDDPNDNDALYSREPRNSNKRDEYYESLEKKSHRSTYIPPPRKNFYATSETIDVSASEEHNSEERPYHQKPSKMEDDEDHYKPERDDLVEDVDHAESHPMIEALHLAAHAAHPHHLYHQMPMQIPPWRYTDRKSYPQPVVPRQMPPVTTPPPQVKEKTPEPSPEPLISNAAIQQYRNAYKPTPRRPAPVHVPKMKYSSDSSFKSIPKPKPWLSEFKIQPTSPKFAVREEKSFISSRSFGRPIRQQFHEQGTRGPNSYKFGYSTGDKENPMARYEERGADGVVRGSYSYIDPRGEKQVVHYESHPKFGFKTMTSPSF